MSAIVTDHWSKQAREFLRPHLCGAQRLVRIATGFFTVQGYDLLRGYLMGKQVHILVGYDEMSKERLRAKMVDDIMAHLSHWEASNRRAAVEDLVRKLESGEMQIVSKETSELLDARIRKQDHAKVFIIDESAALVGSSNLTISGLLLNTEALSAVCDAERVGQWSRWYEAYWTAPDTYDLTQALLEALRRWLGLRAPYDVYLRTIQALVPEEEPERPRTEYKLPTEYQRVVIERVLRQLKEWRGAMLVASTGLGKTVMATHVAHRLRVEGKILNVIVFAPVQIQPDWHRALRNAGLSYQIFTRNLLDQPQSTTRNSSAIRRIEEALDAVDDRYLIVIDESQHFVNRLRAESGLLRRSFQRLLDVANKRKPYVVLLTATPLTKDVDDLNNQLLLLPHTAPPSYLLPTGQMVMEGIGDHLVQAEAWKILDTEQFFEDFIELPVCTVISTSQVAKNFATATKQGDYVEFEDGKRWIPQIEVRKIRVPVPLERQMSQALDDGYFRHKIQSFKHRGQWRRSETTIEEQANLAWASSPLALREVLTQTIEEDGYRVKFLKSKQQRSDRLQPILVALDAFGYEDDAKFQALLHFLRLFHAQGQKTLIFTERLTTAVYLENGLRGTFPELRVANVVEETKAGYALKNFDKEVFDLILDFAPAANRDKAAERKRKARYLDVLISTDAYGVGVNLQDAQVVINYDLAWTPDSIIQRAGRVLRFWDTPRKVSLFVFVGELREDIQRQGASGRVEKRLQQLTRRTRKAEKFGGVPMLPDEDTIQLTTLANLPSVTVENLGMADISQIEEFTGVSRFLKHITELSQNMAYARDIGDDITSALDSGEDQPYVYLLLRYQRKYYWALYDVQRQELRSIQEDALLNMIQCGRETSTAEVDPNEIEEQAQRCKKLWAQTQRIDDAGSIERVCALYLKPRRERSGLAGVLARAAGAEFG